MAAYSLFGLWKFLTSAFSFSSPGNGSHQQCITFKLQQPRTRMVFSTRRSSGQPSFIRTVRVVDRRMKMWTSSWSSVLVRSSQIYYKDPVLMSCFLIADLPTHRGAGKGQPDPVMWPSEWRYWIIDHRHQRDERIIITRVHEDRPFHRHLPLPERRLEMYFSTSQWPSQRGW